MGNPAAKPKIVIVGGGFAGLEAAFYLKDRLQDKAVITLVSDNDTFLYKPKLIYVPFGLDPEELKLPIAKPLENQGIRFIRSKVVEIRPDQKTVSLGKTELPYDFLVLATGVVTQPEQIVGLKEHSYSIATAESMLGLGRVFQKIEKQAFQMEGSTALFLVPRGNKWSGPLYEMALMFETWLQRKLVRQAAHITFATYEETYLQSLGPRIHHSIGEEFEKRHIAGYLGLSAQHVTEHHVKFYEGPVMSFDYLVTFPPFAPAAVFPGLPVDTAGFMVVDEASRRVKAHPDIFSIGDASNFPLKQGHLALLQAGAAADHVAAEILGVKPEIFFEPTGLFIMEEFDKAMLAEAPLKSGGPYRDASEVRAEAGELHKVGHAHVLRLGKLVLSAYLHRRFSAGKPLHTGWLWKGMQSELNLVSKMFGEAGHEPPA